MDFHVIHAVIGIASYRPKWRIYRDSRFWPNHRYCDDSYKERKKQSLHPWQLSGGEYLRTSAVGSIRGLKWLQNKVTGGLSSSLHADWDHNQLLHTLCYSAVVSFLITSNASSLLQEEFKNMIEDAGFYCVQYYNLTGGVVALHSGFKLWDALRAPAGKARTDTDRLWVSGRRLFRKKKLFSDKVSELLPPRRSWRGVSGQVDTIYSETR